VLGGGFGKNESLINQELVTSVQEKYDNYDKKYDKSSDNHDKNSGNHDKNSGNHDKNNQNNDIYDTTMIHKIIILGLVSHYPNTTQDPNMNKSIKDHHDKKHCTTKKSFIHSSNLSIPHDVCSYLDVLSNNISKDQPIKYFLPFIMELYTRILLNFHKMLSSFLYRKDHILNKCKRIRLFLQRNLMRKHDFIYHVSMLHSSTSLRSVEFILTMFIFYHMHILKHFKHWVIKCKQTRMTLQPSKISLNVANRIQVQSQSEFLIGGGTHMFTFDELEPYFTKSIQNNKLLFKFKDYGIDLESEDHDCICTVPMHILLLKLTIIELKIIAATHNIPVSSRMHTVQIQALLKEHMCEDCKDFLAVFEMIDVNEHIRASNLKAVRRYQTKKGIEYKMANMNSVKKHQEKQGEEYHIANLQSAKKHQEKQGEEYKIAHLKSAKKHQEKQGEKYKMAHLISVKRHQKKKSVVCFPPVPPSLQLQHKIISNACQDMMPCYISESGCAVCGKLTWGRGPSQAWHVRVLLI
jgi:hypothetical protein